MISENTQLSSSAQRVQGALQQHGLSFTVVELAASTRTANEAAATIGCKVGQIVKSLLFRGVVSNQPILILASGVNRVNEAMIGALINETIIKAEADFTREVTGFAIGGVPPVGHKQQIKKVLIDQDLFQYEKLWAAAGTPNAVFSLSPGDLVGLTGGEVVDI